MFAADNTAIQQFLDSVYAQHDFDYTQTSDSMAALLVKASIIDCGDAEAYKTSDFEEGAIETTNLDDRYLTVTFDTLGGKTVAIINRDAVVTTPNTEATNGVLHVVSRPLVLSNAYLPQIIAETDNMRIFSLLLNQTGIDKRMTKYRDEAYELVDHTEGRDMEGNHVDQPAHRYFGYTAFVEPDSVFHEKWGIDMPVMNNGVMTNASTILRQVEEKCREAYPYATATQLTDSNNAVNQFVGYHLLPERIAYDKLVIHYGEMGYSYLHPSTLTIDCFEYYETMCAAHRRLIKLTHGAQTDGIRINRIATYNLDSYGEESVPRPGIKISPDNGGRDYNALNGFYYPIDDILIYDDDVTNRVLNERLRFDVSSLLPELMTNGYRRVMRNTRTQMPAGYFDNMTYNDESRYNYLSGFNCGWPNFQGDEHNVTGLYDLTLKLPPVPFEGTYELRWAIPIYPTRGMAQFYFGTDKQNLTALGLPVDLRLHADNPNIGWKADIDGDEKANDEKDKAMRNHGYMMPPKHDGPTTGGVVRISMRDRTDYQRIRKIIYTGTFKPDETYYVRCKSVLANSSTQFVMDWIELVPKNIYNGPTPEDKW